MAKAEEEERRTRGKSGDRKGREKKEEVSKRDSNGWQGENLLRMCI